MELPPAKRRRDAVIRQLKNKYTGMKNELPFYSSRVCDSELNGYKIPKVGFPARYCLREIEDQHNLDFSQNLNTSSYVNVVAEPEEEQICLMGLKVNLADQTVYPASYEIHNKCVNSIAELWNAPQGEDFALTKVHPGAGTVGSTEACLLSGLALKFRWRKWYATKYQKSAEEVLAIRPNIIISTLFQAAWEVRTTPYNVLECFSLRSVMLSLTSTPCRNCSSTLT